MGDDGIHQLIAGGKLSTRFTPGGLVELSDIINNFVSNIYIFFKI